MFPPLADKGRVETAQRLPTAFCRAPLHDGLVEEAMVREKLRRLPREGDGAVGEADPFRGVGGGEVWRDAPFVQQRQEGGRVPRDWWTVSRSASKFQEPPREVGQSLRLLSSYAGMGVVRDVEC